MISNRTLTFSVFQSRLLKIARRRIRNGEYTERGLARLAGISQPHMHNLLKGIRALTPDCSDSLLAALDLGILDLAESVELGGALESKEDPSLPCRIVPLLAGKLGPGWPAPDLRQTTGWRAVPPEVVDCGRRPAMVALAPDPAIAPLFPGAEEAVIDFDEMSRVRPASTNWYLVRNAGAGLLRQVRALPDRIEILGQLSLSESPDADIIPLGSVSILHVIRGRLMWAGRNIAASGPIRSGSHGV